VPGDGRLAYRMEVTDLRLEPAPGARANVDVLLAGKVVAPFRDLGPEPVEERRPASPERPSRQVATGSVVAR
jgi:hypothetical protein